MKTLLLPPTSLLILALIGVAFNKRRFGLPLAFVSLLSCLGLSLPAVVSYWALKWEDASGWSDRRLLLAEYRPQALVVLGGGFMQGDAKSGCSLDVNVGTLLRLRYVAKLARETGLPILVSGGSIAENGNCKGVAEADLMANVLQREFNVSVAWLERESRNTAENARYSLEILDRFDIDRIALVTQAYHMPRALAEFRKSDLHVLPAPTASIGRVSELSFYDWLPSPKAMANSYLLAYEAVGMLWYRFGH